MDIRMLKDQNELEYRYGLGLVETNRTLKKGQLYYVKLIRENDEYISIETMSFFGTTSESQIPKDSFKEE